MTIDNSLSIAPDFFGAGDWRYYPDSLLIRMPLQQVELKRVYFPDLTTAPPDLSNRELNAATSAESKLVFERYNHELDHLMRLMSTSTGLFAHQLDSQLPDQFRWIVSQTSEDRLSEARPLLMDEDLSSQELFSTCTERHAAVRLWYQTDSLKTALFDTLSEIQFVQAITLLSRFRESQNTIVVDAVWPPTPQVSDNESLGTITGRNILEFFAVLTEMDYCGLLADNNNPWRLLVENADYNAVMLLWNGAFPGSSLWGVDQYGRLERDFRLFIRLAYPLELYACLDLALWPPLVPTGVFASATRFTWKDIHPGYRFIKLCEWLQESKVPLTKIDEKRNQRFRRFQKIACEKLGWPAPDELLAVWRADNNCRLLGKPRETSHVMSISLERAGHSRLKMIDRLLEARANVPCDFVIGNVSPVELGVGQLGFITRDAGKLVIGESPNGSWDIGPAIIRSIILSGRFLLRGRMYEGHPDTFRPDFVRNALYVYKRLLAGKGERFESWAQSVLDG